MAAEEEGGDGGESECGDASEVRGFDEIADEGFHGEDSAVELVNRR